MMAAVPVKQSNGIERVGLVYVWEHPTYPVRFMAENVKDSADFAADLLIEDMRGDFPRHMVSHRLNFMALMSRRSTAKELAEQCEDDKELAKIQWKEALEQFCIGVVRRHRAGDPMQHIGSIKALGKKPDLIEKVLTTGKPTLWYGPQGAGKGWLSAAAAVCVATDTPFAGLKVNGPVAVLVLDWEDNEETFQERIGAIINGLQIELTDYPPIYYRKMRGTLPRQMSGVLRDIADKGIGLVVIDSVGLAMGSKSEGGNYEDQAISFFESIRYLEPATVLLIDHVAGEYVSNGKLAGKAFGSVYKMAEARAAWEIRKEQDVDSDEQVVAMHHTKHNHTRKFSSFGIRLDFENSEDELISVRITKTDLKSTVELSHNLSQKEQIEIFLMSEGASWVADIAKAATDGNKATARAQLNQMLKKGKVVKLADGRWGLTATVKASHLSVVPNEA